MVYRSHHPFEYHKVRLISWTSEPMQSGQVYLQFKDPIICGMIEFDLTKWAAGRNLLFFKQVGLAIYVQITIS